jgi:hypothetical protein
VVPVTTTVPPTTVPPVSSTVSPTPT